VRRYYGTEVNIKCVSVLLHDTSNFNTFVNLSDTNRVSNIPNSQICVTETPPHYCDTLRADTERVYACWPIMSRLTRSSAEFDS
jgi:hypothetical protein